ncbi:IS1182 family transposase, partial [Priestia megaterium]|uniref:IS1182 family transposase n=1 Tax=Priestia megaterium TaxID=1404 RepID=UPI002E24C605|nr:IS1182 family transposase [Priestia megaterium]
QINKAVDFSFIRTLLSDRYSKHRGRPAEEPEFMFKICLLEYLYNLSDVQVIEHIRVNLAYRWFLGLNIDDGLPDDTTISYFRVNRVGLDKFQQIFQHIINQCIEHGLIKAKPKRAIIDSTHIIADVAIPTWLTLVRQALTKVIGELMVVDQTKGEIFQQRYEQLWEELKGKTRDEKLPYVLKLATELVEAAESLLSKGENENQAILILKKVIADRTDTAKDRIISIVDPDARTGRKSEKRTIQGYKDHIMIDEESEIITAVKVTPANAEDGDQLTDLVTQFHENHDITPKEVSADKAYWFGKNLHFLHENNIVANISVMKTKQDLTGLFTPNNFTFDPEKVQVTCPNGITTNTYKKTKKNREGFEFRFTKSQCNECPLRAQCTTSKTVRYVYISNYYFDLKRGRAHYQTEKYKEARKNRWLIERRHADKVRNHGLRHSRYRGLERTSIHALMSSIASNIKRMSKLIFEKQNQDYRDKSAHFSHL